MKQVIYFVSAVLLIALALVCADYAAAAWELDSSPGGALAVVLGVLSLAYFAASVVAAGLTTGILADRVSLQAVTAAYSAIGFTSVLPLGLLFGFYAAPVAVGLLAFLLGLLPVLLYLLHTRPVTVEGADADS